MPTNIYDLLIAIIPSIIIGSISLVSIIYSNKKQKSEQNKSMKISKIESLYEKFNKINGNILAEKNGYINDKMYKTSREKVNSIIKEIELLKVESQLYLGIRSIDSLRWSAERLLNQMVENSIELGIKNNLQDGEVEEDEDGRKFKTVPSTFDMCFDEYQEKYDDIEDSIIKIAQDEIGIKKSKLINRKKIAKKS